jgi:K+-transporting ATPase ATPase C chain
MMLKKAVIPALRMLAVMTILTGVVYPLVVTGIAQVIFPDKANGSMIEKDGVIVGSDLIGQQTNDPRYFWWRPSTVDYMQGSSIDNLGSSGATNYGWTNATLAEQVKLRRNTFREVNGLDADVEVPSDMLFASGSGLDPHISPEAAALQIDRVATARGLEPEQVMALVDEYTEQPQFGFLGQPRVNALRLNLALDTLE